MKEEAFTAYRYQIKISLWSICHSPHLSHHSQQRRLECSPAMLCRTCEAAVMVLADVQIAFSSWKINPWWAEFITALIECRWLPCLSSCVSYCRGEKWAVLFWNTWPQKSVLVKRSSFCNIYRASKRLCLIVCIVDTHSKLLQVHLTSPQPAALFVLWNITCVWSLTDPEKRTEALILHSLSPPLLICLLYSDSVSRWHIEP